jgi:hypothetical protein
MWRDGRLAEPVARLDADVVRLLPITGFAIGVFALVLQFSVTIPARMAAGFSLIDAIIFYFSFFTILSNIGVILVYAARIASGRLASFATPLARATVAVCIAIVGLVYLTVLSKIWAPQGLFWLCDVLLHYAAPIVYVLWWAFAGREGTLNWGDAAKILVFPLIYLVYALVRGKLTGLYPYPFIDAGVLGWTRTTINAAAVALLFFIFSFIAISFDRSVKTRYPEAQ